VPADEVSGAAFRAAPGPESRTNRNIAAAVGALIAWRYSTRRCAHSPFIGGAILLGLGWTWICRRHPLAGWAILGFLRGLLGR
jgi:hypothetical protein